MLPIVISQTYSILKLSNLCRRKSASHNYLISLFFLVCRCYYNHGPFDHVNQNYIYIYIYIYIHVYNYVCPLKAKTEVLV